MSTTTARLLRVKRRCRSTWRTKLSIVADRLVAEYGVPRLGNFRDPIREIFFILLSAKTTDAQYRQTHRRLMTAYPKLSELAAARVRDVRSHIASGGLAGKRAGQVVRAAKSLLSLDERNPARALRAMSVDQAYKLLCELPGMGPKSALCVLMYSLDFDTFPVDVNVQRIAERMGALRSGQKHYQAQRQLAAISPDGRSRELHIAMVAHGRKVCLPHRPKCGECCLADLCAWASANTYSAGERV